MSVCVLFFKQKTAYEMRISDWSSDVCSSDLASRDAIISLIDGKPYKTLKRHLSSHGLSIAEYRARYNLPASYPMVAPAYSEHRRNVANRLGQIGRAHV